MFARIGPVLLLVLVGGCSQLNLGGGSSGSRPFAGDGEPASYRALYEHFRDNHRQVFRMVGENTLSVRNAGKRAVRALDEMMKRLSEADRSDLREVASDYRTAWDQFDSRSPSQNERRNLKNAGKDVLRRFQSGRVNVVAPEAGSDPDASSSSASTASGPSSPEDMNAPERKPTNQTTEEGANSAASGYRKMYDRFRKQHRQVLRMVGKNTVAVRKSGDRAVNAVEQMVSMMSDTDRSEREDLAEDYRRAWKQFDPRTPSLIERKNLKTAAEDVLTKFDPESVNLRSGASAPVNGETTDPEDAAAGSPASSEPQKQDLPQIRPSSADDPDAYRQLIDRWQRLHVRFHRGLQTADPMFSTTYDELSDVFDQITSQVSDRQRATVKYYRRQYELIYSRRKDYFGTRKMSDHLDVLKKKFLSDFTAGSSDRERSGN